MGRGLRLASCHLASCHNDVFRLGYDASDTFKVNEARITQALRAVTRCNMRSIIRHCNHRHRQT